MNEIYQALNLESLKTLFQYAFGISLSLALISVGVVQAFRLFKSTVRG